MTMSNNDMVALFPDIVNCMDIPSLEIKKMYGFGSAECFTLADLWQVFLVSRQLFKDKT